MDDFINEIMTDNTNDNNNVEFKIKYRKLPKIIKYNKKKNNLLILKVDIDKNNNRIYKWENKYGKVLHSEIIEKK
ncbi:hypothetical protein MYSEV_024 [Mythimna separata entomopoxvirus 'L']|uniref:Uncharacterized protein n=1 Tax=Mythimna separata entomopoxvirus 'L' TaxID=1293572 RepID=A0A916KQ01_9POXV|nr:hypothetical protein MYSEV_024 [Mythimna separata entomopoxvirus 'L']CCU56222.1 hypothetical protein MYSEV_024 [Mythimna separata entomopoxvirus 'L']